MSKKKGIDVNVDCFRFAWRHNSVSVGVVGLAHTQGAGKKGKSKGMYHFRRDMIYIRLPAEATPRLLLRLHYVEAQLSGLHCTKVVLRDFSLLMLYTVYTAPGDIA